MIFKYDSLYKAVIEKGERSTLICQEISENLAECCTFLVKCMQQANLSSKSVIELYTKNLTTFMKKRDCILSLILFKSVLQLCWEDNWQLALLLVCMLKRYYVLQYEISFVIIYHFI